VLEHRVRTLKRQQRESADGLPNLRILKEGPAQAITWDGLVRPPTSRNTTGSMVAALDANGVREEWLVKTGANQDAHSQERPARPVEFVS
jgi:hypothetical protein